MFLLFWRNPALYRFQIKLQQRASSVSGITLRTFILLCKLNYDGYTTRTGKRISKTKASFILSNSFYIGLFKYGGEIHEGKHEPIISKKLFDEAQEMLKFRGQPERKPQNEPQPFCGLISCASCGMMITGEYKVKKQKNGNVHNYAYYHCTKKRKDFDCPEPCIRQEELDGKL